jgi:hypothetical protein
MNNLFAFLNYSSLNDKIKKIIIVENSDKQG